MDRDALSERLRTTFVAEVADQVRALNASLMTLEKNPEDPEALRSAFRVAHTIKGAARVADLAPIEELCHALESLFSVMREGALTPAPAHFTLLFSVADTLERAGELVAARDELDVAGMETMAAQLQLVASGPLPTGVHYPAPAAPAPVPSPPPPPATPEPASPPPPAAAPEPSPALQDREEWVRVQAHKLDLLLAASTELILAVGLVDKRGEDWCGFQERLGLAATGAEVAAAVQDAARLVENAERDARSLHRVADGISSAVQRLRLRPFRDVCEALPRAVRDLAAASGKHARLELHGEDAEADRLVLDALREPLLHLVRNAVDHGIERPAVRAAAGKPEEATIRVGAALEGDRLIVTVSDDGGGIDAPALRARLAASGRAAPTDDRDLARALLAGGTSTAERATAISGRGVGLDLVRATLERIGGSVSLRWETGRGSTFVLECPPSPAAGRAILVEVSSQIFGIAGSQVERLVRVRPEGVRQAEGRPMLVTTTPPTPIVPLASVLGAPLQARPLSGPTPAVLLQAGGRRVALLVDAVIAEQPLVIRPLALRRRSAAPHVSGGALLPNGRVALVLSPASLLDAALGRAAPQLAVEAADQAVQRRVLVVDDSITTRTLEQSVLEAAGFSVTTAFDGMDGWDRLQEASFDAVVADVEMPRMDGITLCERIRSSGRYEGMALVLVTGLESAEDRARGLAAGADAYLFKSGFDQQHLLDTVQQLIG